MAAYAALTSVIHIIDQIQHHPRPPISLDENQVESLTEKVTFLQEFLEGYSHVGDSKEADDLENRIADAAYAAEDIVESHIVDQIRNGSTSYGKKISSIDFYQSLQKVIEDMDSIKKEVMEIKEKIKGVQYQLQRNSTPVGSLRFSSTGQDRTMVGFDDVLYEMMDKLTGQQSNLQIIPIVGMGGIGKTTLARNTYENPLIKEHFDICAWATISQEYNTREILCEVLCQANKTGRNDSSENELGEILYQHLSGRRYLIVMDDMWSIEAWDEVRRFFPDNNNGSKIVTTTRLSNLSFQLSGSYVLQMKFLDEDESWKLFCRTVFGEEGCPLELEKIGKKIAKGCKGLPLSITVIGGLLAKSNHTQEFWEYIEKNLNAIVNSEDNEGCLKILHMSYNQLPVHLKPCFLYMGVFKEDSMIRVSTLITLWVAEGFLKPISGKSLEVVAKEYLKDLIDRNLILVRKLGSTGNIKCCNIHDLLRDLCLREAEKQKFYDFTWQHSLNNPQCLNTQRRIIILENNPDKKVLGDALQSMPCARSLICDIEGYLPRLNLRLLRILKAFDRDTCRGNSCYSLKNTFELVNLRYLAVRVYWETRMPSSVRLLWNLHTLIVGDDHWTTHFAPVEIWKMPQLRHVEFGRRHLPDPPPSRNIDGRDDIIILGNLQTLKTVANFKCGEEMIKRIPNIKKLGILYDNVEGSSGCCLNNLDRLQKLESLCCYYHPKAQRTDDLQNLAFPHSLKKLTIRGSHVHWEDILEKIGSLPLLEKLKLMYGSFRGRNWETVEGQFRSLKFLLIYRCDDLVYWTTERTHFTRLELLVLDGLRKLKEIPSGIGEIPTLRSIDLKYCGYSAVISAKKILEELEELGEVGLQVRVALWAKNEALESLASPNFQFIDYEEDLNLP